MKIKRNIYMLIAAAVLAAVSTGCSVNEEGIYGSFPYLELEVETVSLPKTASSSAINLESNRSVTASVDVSWVSAKVEDDQIILDWTDNALETTRTATISVSTTNGVVKKEITVTQDASGELTISGDLILRSKSEIASNTYTKTQGNLIIGDVTSVKSKATSTSITSSFSGHSLVSSPSDITDEDIAPLKEQIHLISEKGLAVLNTQVKSLPLEIIKNNDVHTVVFDYNSMSELPSSEVMKSLKLAYLSLAGNDITDISALASCETIKELNISGTKVYDLEPLKSMEGLQVAYLEDLPLTASQVEIFREQCSDLEILVDDIRPEDSPLPVFGDIEVTEISDTEVLIKVQVVKNAENISKAGFYIGDKRVLKDMTYHDASYSGGVMTLTFHPESLHNMIYHVRAYAVNGKGEGYSESSYFGSYTSEKDINIKSKADLDELSEDNYSHVNASVLIGNFSTSSSSSAIRLNDGKYDYYFKSSTDFSDLSSLKSLVFIRDGLYIGNIGLSDLSVVSHIKGIQTLWLRGNKISYVPDLACRETLTYLDLSMNSLTDFSFLSKFPNLKTLYLGSSDTPEKETNDIGVLTGLEKFNNLKYIDLSGLPLHQWQVDDLKDQMPGTEIVFNSGGKDPHIPTVAGKRVTRKGETVTLNGYLTSEGKSKITEYGFYYGKDMNSLEKVKVGDSVASNSSFSLSLTISDLDNYYYYPYAVNAFGESRCAASEFSLAFMDLSQNGTANCYIVQTPGQYKFDATVRGNSVESVGAAASAEIVWQFTDPESTVNNLINFVNLNGQFVEFEVAETASYGNALIAVKDASGNILWSWHIWICDFDPELKAHKYKGGNMVMDRNLGATTATISSKSDMRRAVGTVYQWGRKDPMAFGVVSSTRYPFSTPEESYAEPTVFAAYEAYWTYQWDNEYWSSNQKTMYDPCPPGWTVADSKTWDNISVVEYNQYGAHFIFDASHKAVYPIGFSFDSSFNYSTSDWESVLWTSDFSPYSLPYTLYYTKSTQYLITDRYATDAFAVRCKKDVGFTVSTGDVQATSTKISISGNVRYNDMTPVTERGFVWSTSKDNPTLSNGTNVVCGAGEGDFNYILNDLKPDTTYYLRAYATGSGVTKYGKTVTVTTKKAGSGDEFTEDDYEWN